MNPVFILSYRRSQQP